MELTDGPQTDGGNSAKTVEFPPRVAIYICSKMVQ